MELTGNLLDSFLGGRGGDDSRKKSQSAQLQHYKKLQEKGEILTNVQFTSGGKKEGFWYYDKEGIKVYLPITELYNPNKYKESYVFLDHLDRKYAVMVKNVDEASNTVTVSVLAAQAKMRPEVLKQIDEELAAGRHPKVKAVVKYLSVDNVTYVSRNCFLDILGLDIQGRLKNKDYADCFVPDLQPLLKIGDVIDVAITGKDEKQFRGEPTYKCSRAEAIPSAWEHINELLKVDQMIRVECLNVMGSNFVAKVLDIPDITCSCVYPKDILITPGGIYSGFITKIDPENHHLFVQIGRAER